MNDKPTVLVIDDDIIIRKVISNMLKNNFEVTTASSAFEGLDLINLHNYDAVICDILMPEMNGIDMVKEIRKIDANMPILMITGDTDEKHVGLAFECGVDDYMLKPLSHNILNHKLTLLIKKYKQYLKNQELFIEVKNQEERHLAFINAMPYFVACFDENDMCTFVKPALNFKILFQHVTKIGKTSKEIREDSNLGSEFDDIFNLYIETFENIKKSKEIQIFNYFYFSNDNLIKYVREVTVFPFGNSYAVLVSDISKIKQNEESVIIGSNILSIAAKTASIMLNKADSDNFGNLIDMALNDIGNSINANRVYIFENRKQVITNDNFLDLTHEWVDNRLLAQLNINSQLNNIDYNELDGWYDKFTNGEIIKGDINNYSNNIVKYFKPQKSDYILLIPIFVNNLFWGLIGIESYDHNKIWNDIEINALILCSSILGGGIGMNRSHHKLMESEQKYKSIIQDQTEFIIKWTMPEGLIHFANKSFLDYEQLDESQVGTFTVKDNFANQNWIEIMMKIISISSSNPVVYYELYVKKDDSINCQQLATRGIFNHQNKLIEYQSVGRDITENKKITAELENAKDKISKFEKISSRLQNLNNDSEAIIDITKNLVQRNFIHNF